MSQSWCGIKDIIEHSKPFFEIILQRLEKYLLIGRRKKSASFTVFIRASIKKE